MKKTIKKAFVWLCALFTILVITIASLTTIVVMALHSDASVKITTCTSEGHCTSQTTKK